MLQRGALPLHGAARQAAVARAEAPLAAAVTASGGSVVARIGLIDAIVAKVTPAQQRALAQRSDVEAVVPDRRIRVTPPRLRTGIDPTTSDAPPTRRVHSNVCPSNPAKPEIDPEALTTMSVRPTGDSAGAWQYARGSGVKVGIVAQGIDPNNPDLVRPDGTRVVADYYDVTGAGTAGPVGTFETVIDAESIAAQGRQVFDLNQQGYSSIDPPGCTLRIVGVSPAATLDIVQAVDIEGNTSLSELIRGVDHLVNVDHVDVLNESLGSAAFPATDAVDPLALADEAAVAAGVTVVAASGDSGWNSSLATPASVPDVLAIGGTDQLRTLEQIGYAGPVRGPWADGNIADLSSGGIAQNGKTLDAVAPSFYTWVSCTATARYPDCYPSSDSTNAIELASGTSESAPLVAGVAALVIDAYRRHHHGHSPTPAQVREIITGTSDDLGVPPAEQGAGQVNALRAVRAASAWNGTAAGDSLAVSPTQADLIAATGSAATAAIRVANHGAVPITDSITLRSEAPAGVLRQPFAYDQGDAGFVEHIFSVHVPAGTARLRATALVPDPQVGEFLYMRVFDPHDTYVAQAAPQGLTNTSSIDAARPLAGTWTIKVIGVSYASPPFSGTGELDVRFYRTVSGGAVSPNRVRLAPGAAVTVHATVPAVATAVDGTAALQVRNPATGAVTTVPVAVRRTIPLIGGAGSFAGSLNGGNGRPQGALEGTSLYIDVPAGRSGLRTHLSLPPVSGLRVYAYLIDPSGTAVDRETNVLAGVPQASIDLTALRPTAGRWRLTFGVDGTPPGATDAVGYSGAVSTDAPDVSATHLPRGATLARDEPVTATVHVVNDTAATHIYVADARNTGVTAIPLAVPNPFALPITYENPAPTVTVPPFTQGLLAKAHATAPRLDGSSTRLVLPGRELRSVE